MTRVLLVHWHEQECAERAERYTGPVSTTPSAAGTARTPIEVHHALVDGRQVGEYFAAVQGALEGV